MKKITLSILLVLFCFFSYSQNLILNGSFENNSATGNEIGLTTNWQNFVADSWQVDSGVMDLISSNSCTDPSNGNWFVSKNQTVDSFTYLFFSLKLSSPLQTGNQYHLSFDKYYCEGDQALITIGFSNDSISEGTSFLGINGLDVSNWVTDTVTFEWSLWPVKYFTIEMWGTGIYGFDNFKLTPAFSSSIETEKNKTAISIFPNPVSDDLTIDFGNSSQEEKFELTELSGKILKTIYSSTDPTIKIDMKEFSEGVYILNYRGESYKVIKL